MKATVVALAMMRFLKCDKLSAGYLAGKKIDLTTNSLSIKNKEKGDD
jgi:hypothetical protein